MDRQLRNKIVRYLQQNGFWIAVDESTNHNESYRFDFDKPSVRTVLKGQVLLPIPFRKETIKFQFNDLHYDFPELVGPDEYYVVNIQNGKSFYFPLNIETYEQFVTLFNIMTRPPEGI